MTYTELKNIIIIKKCELISIVDNVVKYKEVKILQCDCKNIKDEILNENKEYVLSEGEKFVSYKSGAEFYSYFDVGSFKTKFSSVLDVNLMIRKDDYNNYKTLKNQLYKKIMGLRKLLKENGEKIEKFEPETMEELNNYYSKLFVVDNGCDNWENELAHLRENKIFDELQKFKDYIWVVIKRINKQLAKNGNFKNKKGEK